MIQRAILFDILSSQHVCLIDYERLTDSQGQRLVAFGKYAGIGGKTYMSYIQCMFNLSHVHCEQE